MTYACTLQNQAASAIVDFNGTWDEGDGPQLILVNDVAVLDAPLNADGSSADMLTDMKFCPVKWTLRGKFKDGFGTMDWNTPGSTKIEKLMALQKLETVPLILTWPVTTKTWYCTIERLTIGEMGAWGATATYDLGLRITAGP